MDIDRLEYGIWNTEYGKSLHSNSQILSSIQIGAHGAGETPVLIPNTEVKLSSGDYTAQAGN